MVPLPLQTTIETELAALITELALKQPAYFAIHGRYWQSTRTHTTPPSDDIPTAANLTRRPTDETQSWADLGIVLPALTSAAYTVHAYRIRGGHGYVIHADVLISGVHHRKSVNVGPANWLTQTWLTAKVISIT